MASNDSSLANTTNIFQVETILHEFRDLHDNDLNQSIATNSLFNPTSLTPNYSDIDLSLPLFKLLHHSKQDIENNNNNLKFNPKIYGKFTKFNNNFHVACRTNLTSTNAYVFIDSEILINNSLCIQIIDVDLSTNYTNSNETSLGFGCTNCSIDKLRQNDLPNDSYDLLNRQEYWIVNKNILNSASVGDELCILVDNSGSAQNPFLKKTLFFFIFF